MRRDLPHDAMFESDDLAVILLEAVVRSVWLVLKAVASLGVFAIRHPLVLGTTAVLVALGRWQGWQAPAALGTALGLGLLGWRVTSPSTFAYTARPRLSSVWRGAYYRYRWPRVASRHGLVTHDAVLTLRRGAAGEVPRINRVVVGSNGIERLRIRLPVGLTPEDVAARCDGLAHAFGCRQARVTMDRPGRLWLELHRRDALATAIRPLSTPELVDLAAVPIGTHEDGSPWHLRVLGTHLLVAGATGAGKGSVLWSLMHATAPAIGDGSLQVWAIDPKGGMELRPGLPLFARFEDSDPVSMCRLLEDLVALKDRRAKELAAVGIRSHQATPESPHVIAVIDELATLTAFAERTTVRRIDQALGLLLTQGRACGITVLAAVQDPGKDVVAWRDLFPTRIALRLDNPIQVDMVLGDGARDLGAAADRISELTPGVAYVRVEGTRALRRVRSAYLTDDDITALASSMCRPLAVVANESTHDGGEAA